MLSKIETMIESARFGIFDVSGWNANVALELGVAIGQGTSYYIAFNPADPDNPKGEVPADLGGIDRIQYESMTELEEGVARVLAQVFGVPRAPAEAPLSDPFAILRERVIEILRANSDGLLIGELAGALDATVDVAQVVIKPLVASGRVTAKGKTRGRRYFAK